MFRLKVLIAAVLLALTSSSVAIAQQLQLRIKNDTGYRAQILMIGVRPHETGHDFHYPGEWVNPHSSISWTKWEAPTRLHVDVSLYDGEKRICTGRPPRMPDHYSVTVLITVEGNGHCTVTAK